jgi:outer membrane protein assembly factor BamD (BamD/ComL family)
MSLYFSGKDAYNSGNYAAAQQYFQEALVKDENIEAKAQNIKYMLGVSAFNILSSFSR